MGERVILSDPQRAIMGALGDHEQGLQGVRAEALFAALEREHGFTRTRLREAADELKAERLLDVSGPMISLTRAGHLCGRHNICGGG